MPGGGGLSEPGLTRVALPVLHPALTQGRGWFDVACRLVDLRSHPLIHGHRRATRLHDTHPSVAILIS